MLASAIKDVDEMFHHGCIQRDVCSHAEDLGKVIDWMRDEDRRLKFIYRALGRWLRLCIAL